MSLWGLVKSVESNIDILVGVNDPAKERRVKNRQPVDQDASSDSRFDVRADQPSPVVAPRHTKMTGPASPAAPTRTFSASPSTPPHSGTSSSPVAGSAVASRPAFASPTKPTAKSSGPSSTTPAVGAGGLATGTSPARGTTAASGFARGPGSPLVGGNTSSTPMPGSPFATQQRIMELERQRARDERTLRSRAADIARLEQSLKDANRRASETARELQRKRDDEVTELQDMLSKLRAQLDVPSAEPSSAIASNASTSAAREVKESGEEPLGLKERVLDLEERNSELQSTIVELQKQLHSSELVLAEEKKKRLTQLQKVMRDLRVQREQNQELLAATNSTPAQSGDQSSDVSKTSVDEGLTADTGAKEVAGKGVLQSDTLSGQTGNGDSGSKKGPPPSHQYVENLEQQIVALHGAAALLNEENELRLQEEQRLRHEAEQLVERLRALIEQVEVERDNAVRCSEEAAAKLAHLELVKSKELRTASDQLAQERSRANRLEAESRRLNAERLRGMAESPGLATPSGGASTAPGTFAAALSWSRWVSFYHSHRGQWLRLLENPAVVAVIVLVPILFFFATME